MIKYRLICNICDFKFDSWFASSEEYEKLKIKKFLSCLKCNSKKVEKTLMAPKLINKINLVSSEKKNIKFNEVRKKITEYQEYIKDNFEYVGDKFAYEARSIHYNHKKKNKGIYGTASNREIEELKEEGVQAELLPWIEDKRN